MPILSDERPPDRSSSGNMDKKLILKRGKEAPVRRFHPWVFSGAVSRLEGNPQDGDPVSVHSSQGDHLGWAHFQSGKVTARMLTHGPERPNAAFWRGRLSAALNLRIRLGLTGSSHTTAYRLVHGEGDGLPGLIIDIYGRVAVLQCHSIGMHAIRHDLCTILLGLEDLALDAVYDKSMPYLSEAAAEEKSGVYLSGHADPCLIKEHDLSFMVNWETGQKTGFFLDQRENRRLIRKFAPGADVLNLFAYSGGFSVYALAAGAHSVTSVDSSARALEWADENVDLLGKECSGRHTSVCQDVMQFLSETPIRPGLMIVDPPAFAKSPHKRHQAVQAYKRLNARAISKLSPGGILFTFSCSEVISQQLFYDTIVAAGLEAGRPIQVLHHLSQGPDHPVSLYHPEGNYLKGLVLSVT